jgi:hypothetical protein
MNRKFLPVFAATLFFGSAIFCQPVSQGARLYIEPMNGFENYLTAAILAKKVPVSVVLDKSRADYVAEGTFKQEAVGASGIVSILRPAHNETNYSASVSVIDQKTDSVAFAYSSQRNATHNASKQVAEDWATHLRDEMLKEE